VTTQRIAITRPVKTVSVNNHPYAAIVKPNSRRGAITAKEIYKQPVRKNALSSHGSFRTNGSGIGLLTPSTLSPAIETTHHPS
jgi:hypothetical protein